ncbi:MAG: V-type ATPase subunit [Deltaproteobacteria bacterium]|nr:V-type ATPase subunit [Candidatus Zymogenaceae bacterium]
MKSRLLDDVRYRQLLETTSLEGFLKILQETAYAPQLMDIDSGNPDITEISRALDQNLLMTYHTIFKFFTPKVESSFLFQLLGKLEVENLKIILRGKYKGISSPIISDTLIETNGYSALDFDELLNSKDIANFISALSSSPYGRMLEKTLPLFEKEHRTVVLERCFDRVHYTRLWGTMNELSGVDKNMVKMYLGTFFDITNIMIILRYRIFYDMGPEEVKAMIHPMRYKMNAEEAKRLSMVTKEDYRDVFAGTYYGRRVGPYQNLSQLERSLNLILLSVIRKMLTGPPFHIGTVVAYLSLKEIEVTNLKSIAEGKRHALGAEEISDVLILRQ